MSNEMISSSMWSFNGFWIWRFLWWFPNSIDHQILHLTENSRTFLTAFPLNIPLATLWIWLKVKSVLHNAEQDKIFYAQPVWIKMLLVCIHSVRRFWKGSNETPLYSRHCDSLTSYLSQKQNPDSRDSRIGSVNISFPLCVSQVKVTY